MTFASKDFGMEILGVEVIYRPQGSWPAALKQSSRAAGLERPRPRRQLEAPPRGRPGGGDSPATFGLSFD